MNLRQQLSQEIEETRQAFHAILSDLPGEVLDLASDNPDWTVRQVLFHMSLAPRMLSRDLKMILANRWYYRLIPIVVPRVLFDALNKWYTKFGARGANQESLAEEYDKAHTAAWIALDSIQESDFKKSFNYPDWDPLISGEVTVEKLFQYVKVHFDFHEKEIRAALEMWREKSRLS